MRDTRNFSTFRSRSTRAVIPTLVATMAAATNAASWTGCPSARISQKPAMKGKSHSANRYPQR